MRILVAEDGEDIKTIYYMSLVERGHKIILTSDGEECLMVYRQKLQEQQQQQQQRYHDKDTSSSPFDVVILDYKMPKKDGLQAAKEILDINPEQRIIFCFCLCQRNISRICKGVEKGGRADAKALFNVCISRYS
jgi:CheY-like chemotaxis protein